jgi:hypothetical protein
MRFCTECASPLSASNTGRLCGECQTKQREKIAAGTREYYDVYDVTDKFGLESPEQVRRMWRKGLLPPRIPGARRLLWVKEDFDKWYKSGDLPLRRPASPLQQEAYKQCMKKDHGWLSDEKFDGIAYGKENVSEPGEYAVNIKSKRTCYFCGHAEILEL